MKGGPQGLEGWGLEWQVGACWYMELWLPSGVNLVFVFSFCWSLSLLHPTNYKICREKVKTAFSNFKASELEECSSKVCDLQKYPQC